MNFSYKCKYSCVYNYWFVPAGINFKMVSIMPLLFLSEWKIAAKMILNDWVSCNLTANLNKSIKWMHGSVKIS